MGDPALRGESDAELVVEAREGSEKAFRTLVERYHPMAYAVVRGILGDRSDVEDVAQEVFIKVFRGLPGFRGDSKLSTWIFTVARNEAFNAARKSNPADVSIENIVLESPEELRPDSVYRRRIRQEEVERGLSELDPDYRLALELRYMGEMSYAEISEVMGLPIGTVKTYIHRAKIELKRVMSRRQFVETHRQREHP
jgi:RNA polymerase sigma-70 factor, ECF subfamily